MSKKISVGLDIGSTAVRAAEVVIDGDRKVLQRFAQVGLPDGAVVEGEVRDQTAVASALKRLWEHGHFSTKKVIIGLASQRAMVRQVEMPQMSDVELRSALRFKIGEFLPIPVEQAVVDFAPLPTVDGSTGKRTVLLVAAQREVVVDELAAVKAAGLQAQAVDSSSLALLRAIAPSAAPEGGAGTEGMEAVVGIGAHLVTVTVRDGGMPRFVRTVTLTGQPGMQGPPDLGAYPADRSNGGGRTGSGGVAVGVAPRIDVIVNEVRSSLEYLLSQSGSRQFERVLVTGGGAMLPGLNTALSSALGLPVSLAEASLQLDEKALGLDTAALEEASHRWLTAVGLALWGTDAYGRPSLMPAEELARRQQRRAVATAAAAVLIVAVGLGGLSFSKVETANNVNNDIKAANSTAATVQQKINGLGYVIRVPNEVHDRRLLAVQALDGDIDWIGFVHRLQAALPSDVVAQSVVLTKLPPQSTGASTLNGEVVGTLSVSAETTGGAKAVARFIDRVSEVKGLAALWVSSTTNSSGTTQIQAAGQLTSAALSTRAAALPGRNDR